MVVPRAAECVNAPSITAIDRLAFIGTGALGLVATQTFVEAAMTPFATSR